MVREWPTRQRLQAHTTSQASLAVTQIPSSVRIMVTVPSTRMPEERSQGWAPGTVSDGAAAPEIPDTTRWVRGPAAGNLMPPPEVHTS